MLALGGYLKKKETLSARLGDVLSSMYLASMVLKHHENQGREADDLPLVEWACRSLLYQAQEQLHLFLRNFPNRPLAAFMRLCIFPRGLDLLRRRATVWAAPIGDLVMNPTATRERLSAHIYKTAAAHNPLGQLQEALMLCDRGGTPREAHPRGRRQDRPRHRARSAGTDRAGAKRSASSARPKPRCLRITTPRLWISSMSMISHRMNWAWARSSSAKMQVPHPLES